MIPPIRSRTAEQFEEYEAGLTDWLEANGLTYEEWEARCKAAAEDFA